MIFGSASVAGSLAMSVFSADASIDRFIGACFFPSTVIVTSSWPSGFILSSKPSMRRRRNSVSPEYSPLLPDGLIAAGDAAQAHHADFGARFEVDDKPAGLHGVVVVLDAALLALDRVADDDLEGEARGLRAAAWT